MLRFPIFLAVLVSSVSCGIPGIDSADKSLSGLINTCSENPAACGMAVETLMHYLDGIENLLMDNVKDEKKIDEIIHKYQSIAHQLSLVHNKNEAEQFKKTRGNDIQEHLDTASEALMNMSALEMEHWVKYLNDIQKFAETIYDDEL